MHRSGIHLARQRGFGGIPYPGARPDHHSSGRAAGRQCPCRVRGRGRRRTHPISAADYADRQGALNVLLPTIRCAGIPARGIQDVHRHPDVRVAQNPPHSGRVRAEHHQQLRSRVARVVDRIGITFPTEDVAPALARYRGSPVPIPDGERVVCVEGSSTSSRRASWGSIHRSVRPHGQHWMPS